MWTIMLLNIWKTKKLEETWEREPSIELTIVEMFKNYLSRTQIINKMTSILYLLRSSFFCKKHSTKFLITKPSNIFFWDVMKFKKVFCWSGHLSIIHITAIKIECPWDQFATIDTYYLTLKSKISAIISLRFPKVASN